MENSLVRKTARRIKGFALVAAVLAFGQAAFAQDFTTFQGNNQRTGRPTLAPSTPPSLPTVWNNPGRSFLRWWDPIQQLRTIIDTNEVGTLATPAANWAAPAAGTSPFAFNFIQNNIGMPAYRYTTTVPALDFNNPTVQASGTLATYAFNFNLLTVGTEYEVYLNVPLGPTDTDPAAGNTVEGFPQRYLVVQIDGVVGGPFVEIIDTFASGGAFVQLGDTLPTNLFTVDVGGTITVTVFNTSPKAPNGSFLDPFANPGNELVYADAAMIVGQAGASGVYTASPIVGELTSTPPIGGAVQFPRRVVSSRIEDSFIGALNRQVSLGVVTSFTYNGQTVFDPTGTGRKNMVWSWPFKRPHGNIQSEIDRAATEKSLWVQGPNAANSRAFQRIQVDNLNGSSTSSGFFASSSTLTNFIGENYLEAPAVLGPASSAVTWAPYLPEGRYFLQVWLPDLDTGATVPTTATYEVLSGATVIDTVTVNQSTGSGWVTLPGQPALGYNHTFVSPLSLRCLDRVTNAADLGRQVYADAARFVRESDLSIDSTPVQVTATMTVGGIPTVRDVMIVAMEDGRIYCIDAHGDPVTGDPPQTYWVYPSEDPATDPNAVPVEDGKDRIAEMPTGFDLSSALVQNVGGVDLLFIGSQNGRVYCLEMAGRGDGTTVRRWTYPDDYNPLTPGAQIAPTTLGPIAGSIAYGTGPGAPTIYVPTTQGRIFALDAAGNAASRTTTVTWQYPPALGVPVGPINMAPTVAFGRVYFGAATDTNPALGGMYAVNEATGALDWQVFGTGTGLFPNFGSSSPVAVPGAELIGGGPFAGVDSLIFVDELGRVVSLNANTGGFQWETAEVGVRAVGSPVFTYQTVYNNIGVLQANTSVVVIPFSNGRIVSMLADGSTTSLLNRMVWGFALDGDQQVASIAVGGKAPLESFSWMYTGDSNGNFFAWNHDPALPDNNQQIFPGTPPAQEESTDDDPTQQTLNDIIANAQIQLLVPEAYDQLFEDLQNGSLSYAQIQTAATTQMANRRDFEFGETLYVLVYDLPTGTGSLANYFIEFNMNGGARGSRARQIQTRAVPTGAPAGSENMVLVALPILPTGASGVRPGPADLEIRAVAPNFQNRRSTAFSIPYRIANPMGLAFEDNTGAIVSSVGNTTNAAAPTVTMNGTTNTDQNPAGPGQPVTLFRPTLTAPLGDVTGHGTAGVTRALVLDRSLLNLIFGSNRGLQNVRFGPGDIAWRIDSGDPVTGGTRKSLLNNAPVLYPGFEDYPIFSPNTSLDYPDIRKDRLAVSKSTFGFVENPIYSGVSLVPPTILPADRANYRTNDPTNGYDMQMTRTLQSTIFDMTLNVPRFQPPSNRGYFGTQTVFVDSERPGFDGNAEPYRTFSSGVAVAVDERVTVGTPTVDLGSLPSGGGFNGGVGFGPLQPWIPATVFSPWNPIYTSGMGKMFEAFQVYNIGNVNLLNVRVSKELDTYRGGTRLFRPLELFAPGLHELSWLDGALHLHSDLDPRFSATWLAGVDPQARNILQKARPGDVAPTQLSVNPRSRINPNLRNSGNYLLSTAAFPPGDPKVGVTAPIGTPVGDYIRRIYAFEDILGSNRRPDLPSLAQDESFSDPGMNLKFTLRESRLTSRPTTKAASNIENNITGTEPFRYSSMTPTVMRNHLGNLFVAFVSDRVDNANVPNWVPKVKTEADAALNPAWRIYITSLVYDTTIVPGDSFSPIGDLNGWQQPNNTRWFRQAVTNAYPTAPPAALFTLGAGDSIVPGTVQFGGPAFPSGGAFNPFDFPAASGRAGQNQRYMAYLGSAMIADAAGTRRQTEQIMLSNLTFAADGSITETGAWSMPYDLLSNKSKPSVVQANQNATLFYTTASTGFGRVNFVSFDGANWTAPRALDMGNAFESVGAPSAVLRRWRNSNVPFMSVAFTAKLRGRAYSEAFMTRLECDPTNFAPLGDQPQRAFGPRIDELIVDTASGIYWSPGAVWRLARTDLVIPNPTTPYNPAEEFIDLYQVVNGNLVSIVDKTTRTFDRESGLITYTTTFGGKAFVDTRSGSVRMSGALVPRNLRLYVRYAPYYMRISTGPGANYRSVSMVYDDRFIGIFFDPFNPLRNLLGDLAYWGNEFNARPANNELLRWDRHAVTFTRTSGDGTQATRPFVASYRFGIHLPTAIALNANGTLANFQVQWIDNVGLPASERFYQVDPSTGRVFFLAGMEDRRVRITYTGVNENGQALAPVTIEAIVDPLVELREEAVPIEQAGNESSMSIAFDPLSGNFNRQDYRRPPVYWLFWTSTRTGPADVYFETIAPRFTPRPPN